MLKKIALATALLSTVTATYAAGDAAKGEEKAATCVACHGPAGNSTIAANPILAGQYRTYLIHAMKAYKTGERKNPIMQGMVAALTEEDINDLAAYFSSQDGLKSAQ